MMWGITAVVMSPQKLLEQFQQVYFKCLPPLKVNCHIDLPWWMIPERYQGLEMANYALVSLASKLSLFQCNWGFDIDQLKTIMIGYESFMVEVGLYGNTTSYEYKTHSMPATNNTWYENVWELSHYFNIWLNFNGDLHLKPARKGDKSLMSEFLRCGEFSCTDIVSLNIMRMHKIVIHTSNIVLCDGKTIKLEMLTNIPGQSNMHKFPTQQPTPSDLELWKRALRKISSNFFVLTIHYINKPHEMPLWTTNADGSILHNTILQDDGEYHKVYIPSSNPLTQKTRSGQHFNSKMVVDGQSEFQSYASHLFATRTSSPPFLSFHVYQSHTRIWI